MSKLLILALCTLGGYLVYGGAYSLYLYLTHDKFQVSDGYILESKLIVDSNHGGVGVGARELPEAKFKIKYLFDVDGQEVRGNRVDIIQKPILPGDFGPNEASMEKVGSKVVVKYNPNNPDVNYIWSGRDGFDYRVFLQIAFGCFWLLLAFFVYRLFGR
ncbi:MAG: DUF3592 domain-containing protein [Sedimenticola sp.]